MTTATGVFTTPGEVYTGKVRIVDTGGGNYNILTQPPGGADFLNDASFGAYYAGYGTTDESGLPNGGGVGNVQIKEDCGTVSYIGASQWGEVYTITALSVDGPVLNLTWENDYGEGGIVVITRTDGTDWNPDLTN